MEPLDPGRKVEGSWQDPVHLADLSSDEKAAIQELQAKNGLRITSFE